MNALRQAFIARWVEGNFGLTAYENAPFNPVNGMAYAAVSMLENDISGLDLADRNVTDGVFQIILRYPVGTGDGAITSKVQDIFNHFRIGSRISFGGQSAVIERQRTQPGVAEAGWYVLVVTLEYRAKLVR
jgi:hypothetical protein